MRCWIVLLNNATEVYVEVIVETGERFRSSALPRLPNRLESPSSPRRLRLSRSSLPCLQQVRQTLGMLVTSRSLMYGTLGQFMPDLPQGQSLLPQLVRSQDDRLLLRNRVKVDTITAILPADTLTIRSCVAFLWARVSLIRSLMTLRSSWLTDTRMLSTSTSLAVYISNGSAMRRKDHVPKYRSINSPRCFANLVSRPSLITSNLSASPVVRRCVGRGAVCQTPEMTPYCLREQRI
jgi:hypothetical protein